MIIEVTDKQRDELLNILYLLQSDSIDVNKLAFSLLETNYEFLNNYTLSTRNLYLKDPVEYFSFLDVIQRRMNFATQIFIKRIIGKSNIFGHL